MDVFQESTDIEQRSSYGFKLPDFFPGIGLVQYCKRSDDANPISTIWRAGVLTVYNIVPWFAGAYFIVKEGLEAIIGK